MSNLTRTDKAHLAATSDDCWSCGASATRPDGLCRDCGTIDAQAVPDITSPTWKGNTKPFEAIFVAPPNARTVR
jgi:ribosomal protein L32